MPRPNGGTGQNCASLHSAVPVDWLRVGARPRLRFVRVHGSPRAAVAASMGRPRGRPFSRRDLGLRERAGLRERNRPRAQPLDVVRHARRATAAARDTRRPRAGGVSEGSDRRPADRRHTGSGVRAQPAQPPGGDGGSVHRPYPRAARSREELRAVGPPAAHAVRRGRHRRKDGGRIFGGDARPRDHRPRALVAAQDPDGRLRLVVEANQLRPAQRARLLLVAGHAVHHAERRADRLRRNDRSARQAAESRARRASAAVDAERRRHASLSTKRSRSPSRRCRAPSPRTSASPAARKPCSAS